MRDSQGEGERYSTYTVSGKITNVGPEDAVDVVVTATIYDALGRVIGTRRAPPEHNVIPRGGRYDVHGPAHSHRRAGKQLLASPCLGDV